MPDRATRPLNDGAAKAADDSLYQNHASDSRPNALYDAEGNRKPLDPDSSEQAGLRQEWMAAYKANGGETEQSDTNAAPVGQVESSCEEQKVKVDPVIVGTALDYDESEQSDEAEEDESEAEDEEDEAAESSEWKPTPDEEPEDDDES